MKRLKFVKMRNVLGEKGKVIWVRALEVEASGSLLMGMRGGLGVKESNWAVF